MTELGKSVLLIASLLIIPGLVLQGYAQMYEMPSQEDMERMMPKPVSGTYTNLENRVSVTFPSGWSGTVNLKLFFGKDENNSYTFFNDFF